MEIKTRKQAMMAGENTYFTGKPCKNGHMSYRYVQSGTCYDCINLTKILPDSPTASARERRLTEVAATLQAKNLVKENLALVKVRVFAADRDSVALVAFALATMRFPMLKPSDVDPKLAPSGGEPSGTALYSFYCHGDDIAALRAAANDTTRKYATDIEQKRQEAIRLARQWDEPDTTPPMSFK